MTKFLDQNVGFGNLRFAEGICLGLLIAVLMAIITPQRMEIVRVPVHHVVQKEVIVKVPQYLNSFDKQQINCLAENTYFEAGNQSRNGKIAVTNVVMNRIDSNKFPKTACAVIRQKVGHVCQFSWVCQKNHKIRDAQLFEESKNIAEQVYLENIDDITGGAIFYHADYVKPGWRNVKWTTTIGDHIFYRGI